MEVVEVWGNCGLGDVDMVHTWYMLGGEKLKNDEKPNFEAKVHGDGMVVDHLWIRAANRPHTNQNGNCWCMVVVDEHAYRS